MKALPATMTLKEIARLSGMARRTLQRHFALKGIGCEGRRVLLADIRDQWERFYASLAIAYERPAPRCPECGEMTERACVMCDFKAA